MNVTSRAPLRRRQLLEAVAGLGVSGLAGCASLLGPQEVFVSETQILAALAQRFPFQVPDLPLLDVVAATPRLRLLPQANRLATELDMSVTERLLGKRFSAVLGASYGLRVDPADATLRLIEPRLERLELGGRGVDLASAIGRIGSGVTQALVQDVVLHRFEGAQLARLRDLGYDQVQVQVRSGGVALRLAGR